MTPRFLEKYKNEVTGNLAKEFGYKNVMEIPRLKKIVVNIGAGEAKVDIKYMDVSMAELTAITGQRPLLKRAKKSVAGFKVRQGMPVACTVTLRGARMWEFLDRLISLAIPRIRDFRGLPPNSFDGRGNYTFGVTEQLIFPEVDYDQVDHTRGMDITIVTTARSDAEGKALLSAFGFPFRREGNQ